MSSIAMEYVAQVLRGWPSDGSIDRNELVKLSGGVPVALKNGDLVQSQSDGTVDLVGSTATGYAGLVIRGPGDSKSAANSMGSLNDVGSTSTGTSGKAVVLWGNYIVQTSNYASGSWVPGAAVTAKNGQFALAAPASITTAEGSNTLGDPVIGFVLNVIAGGAGQTTPANVVICVR